MALKICAGRHLGSAKKLPIAPTEGFAVERWGNPDVLDLVRDDPTIVRWEPGLREKHRADAPVVARSARGRIAR